MDKEKRLEAFEAMLLKIREDYEKESKEMEKLKAQGKEKTATYKQYLGNRLMYNRILSMYEEFGLIE